MQNLKHRLAFALIMGIITTALISFTLISINIGFGNKFLGAWLKSWAVSYTLAVALMLTIAPRIQYFVATIFKNS
jgi:hypothetical protein